jgi:hypothetical protein
MMSAVEPGQICVEHGQAEALLSDVAAELVRLPFEGRTRSLHLRALELKRQLGQWATAPIDDARRTVKGILALRDEAAVWRELIR